MRNRISHVGHRFIVLHVKRGKSFVTEVAIQPGDVSAPAHLLEHGFGGDAHFLVKAHYGAFHGAVQPVQVVLATCRLGGLFLFVFEEARVTFFRDAYLCQIVLFQELFENF